MYIHIYGDINMNNHDVERFTDDMGKNFKSSSKIVLIN